jgi:hypothetical protein
VLAHPISEEAAMGWWKVQGTDDTIGDDPLDALGGAVTSVIEEYQTAFNRRPTRAEWAALLTAVLGGGRSPTSGSSTMAS